MKPAIIIHGGAGDWPKNRLPKANEILEEAAKVGLEILRKKGSSLDAVEKSVNILENSGYFNAGLGSVKQLDGKQRMDAAIMEGKYLRCGGVMIVENILNPISAARKVMENTEHVLLSGKFATKFAVKNGIKTISKYKKPAVECDTVGAIAVDYKKVIAVGNSTGGAGKMLAGRVGDCAVIGAGLYATKKVGAMVTGKGEAAIRTTVSRKACDLIEEGYSVQEAAKRAIKMLTKKTGFKSGIIILNKNGDYGVWHNTKAMPWAYRRI
mgnify:CR=1 FL=1